MDLYHHGRNLRKPMDLTGQTALVTGASRNIGRAIAVELARGGADVAIAANTNRDGARETATMAEDAGAETTVTMADLASPAEIEEMVDEARDSLGPVDILVNNATYRPTKPFLDVGVSDIDSVMDVNFRGLFLTSQAVAPDMIDREGGSIIHLIGAMVYLGRDGHTHSYGSKMAIEGLVRQMATELGPRGIRVNGLSPGLIDTDREQTEEWERIERQVVKATPLGRMGTVDEIADACRYLASDRASFVTGQVLHVNGGSYPIPSIVSSE